MFSIFNRKPRYQDLSWMAVDMHTHLLPGLDDGSTSVADSTEMITRMHKLGIVQFYGTPHVQQDIYPNSNTAILAAYQQLQQTPALKHIHIDYAAEYTVEKAFLQQVMTATDNLLALADNYVLIGMSYVSESPYIEQVINTLIIKGYTPVLANVERYVYYHQDSSSLKKFKDLGCLLQVGLLSCYGYYGSKEKNVVKSLLDHGLVDLLGTDVHYERHVKAIEHFVGKQDLSPYFAGKIKNKELFLNNQGIDA
ncbi:tyrosine-protein phosphatase [Sphingobacterium bambusae]|uniref:protein-tyrosine-phosphatase n=1 Tax=Sphingobacterium bambusae TaxID=662858 RepID=A0ABW6BEU4_9SPHI|nr:CpsB/CapC family capsule biosynthesis tyrosine phosphatase [Sphingobacterium bambusae]WPL46866.1 CpsB/CapC family capsule biosynthesis tyrosine phosphatase [Sphingobacterium bambusae]